MLLAFRRHTSHFDSKDLGALHRYIQTLLTLLILYNDPFFYWRHDFIQAFFESVFISYQLFVWLVLVHAAGTRLAFLIDKRKFYWPKWTFLAVLWDV